MRILIAPLLISVVGISHAQEPSTFGDKFEAYADGSDGSPTWKPLTREWVVRDGISTRP